MRKPLFVPARSRRAIDEHLLVRFPRVYGMLVWWVTRLPPESRIRQAMIWRATEQGFAATNRRDFEAVLPRYDPNVEFLPSRALVGVGIAASYCGHDGSAASRHRPHACRSPRSPATSPTPPALRL